MKIENNTVVLFHYRLRDESGTELENSHNGDPTAYMHGQRNIITGLEAAMAGKEAGDIFSATVPPEQGYGLRREGSQQRVPIKHLMGKAKPKVGAIVSIQTETGPRQATVIKVGKFNVDVDTNHPLAGKALTFDIEVVEVRQATAEEISHGHAHGVGGHHH